MQALDSMIRTRVTEQLTAIADRLEKEVHSRGNHVREINVEIQRYRTKRWYHHTLVHWYYEKQCQVLERRMDTVLDQMMDRIADISAVDRARDSLYQDDFQPAIKMLTKELGRIPFERVADQERNGADALSSPFLEEEMLRKLIDALRHARDHAQVIS